MATRTQEIQQPDRVAEPQPAYAVPLPQQTEFLKIPTRFGHVPVGASVGLVPRVSISGSTSVKHPEFSIWTRREPLDFQPTL